MFFFFITYIQHTAWCDHTISGEAQGCPSHKQVFNCTNRSDTFTSNTDTYVSPRVCEPGNTALYWILLVPNWKRCQPWGSMRRNLQVTCTFLFEALCFSSAPFPAGCRWPFSALPTGRLYSFLLPSKIQSHFKICFGENRLIKKSNEMSHYNDLVTQLSLFLFQLCQPQSQLSAALQLLLPQHLSVLGCVSLCTLLLDLWKRKTRTIN